MRYSVLVALIALAGACQEPDGAPREVVRPVKFFEVQADGRSGRAEYPGRIAASNEAELSFEAPGKLTDLNVEEGDKVKKGQVLARIGAEEYSARLDLTKARERAAQADYERTKQLYATDAATKQELDVARRNYEMAQAQTRMTMKTMGDTVLKAPFAGVVARTMVENYQSVQAKQPVLLLQDVDEDGFEIKIDVPERDIAGAEKGLSLKQRTEQMKPRVVVNSAPDKELPAYFKATSTVADPVTRTFEVTLGFEPPDGINVAPGMTGRVVVTWPPVKGENAKILIPAQAIVPGDKKGYARVWQIDPKTNVAKGRDVEVGAMTGDQVEVLKGLGPDTTIAMSGVQQLRDGMKVSRYEMKSF